MGGRGEGGRQIISVEIDQEPRFEYDPEKSKMNKEKHGIDFDQAKKLGDDSDRIEAQSAYIGENRNLLTAKYNGKLYTAITTNRDGAIRIISVRRARPKEVAKYEQGA